MFSYLYLGFHDVFLNSKRWPLKFDGRTTKLFNHIYSSWRYDYVENEKLFIFRFFSRVFSTLQSIYDIDFTFKGTVKCLTLFSHKTPFPPVSATADFCRIVRYSWPLRLVKEPNILNDTAGILSMERMIKEQT